MARAKPGWRDEAVGGSCRGKARGGTRGAHDAIVTPLRKRSLTGALYERDPKTNALISELAALPRDELIARAAIRKRADPGYIPSECLIYFIRASRRDNNEAWFERLYRILIERVLAQLAHARKARMARPKSLTRGLVRDKVFGRFVELLSADRAAYVDKLDYFEVRFDGAVASLRRDAQEKAWRDENRSRPLEYDEESGELSPEVEAAAGTYDPFAGSDFDDPAYRSRFDAAIEALPPEQSRIIHMLRQGYPHQLEGAGRHDHRQGPRPLRKDRPNLSRQGLRRPAVGHGRRRRAVNPAANAIRESVLDAFAVESEPDRSTLERYLRLYPEYAGELVGPFARTQP